MTLFGNGESKVREVNYFQRRQENRIEVNCVSCLFKLYFGNAVRKYQPPSHLLFILHNAQTTTCTIYNINEPILQPIPGYTR